MGDPASDADEALIQRMSRGDRAALGLLYHRHAPRLRALCSIILRDGEEADDLLHDVFIEAWKHAPDYAPERGTVSAWLGLRTRSRAIDRVRAQKAHAEKNARAALDPPPSDPSADPVRTLEHVRLPELLAEVSDVEREVLMLGYFEGLSSSEIGERVGVPLGTVKSRTRSALEKLRRAFERRGSDA